MVPLLSPQGWDYVLLLATPAVALIIDRLPELSRPWRIAAWTALAVQGLVIFDLVGRQAYGLYMRSSIVTLTARSADRWEADGGPDELRRIAEAADRFDNACGVKLIEPEAARLQPDEGADQSDRTGNGEADASKVVFDLLAHCRSW